MALKLVLCLFLVCKVHGYPSYMFRIPNGDKVTINGDTWRPVGHSDKQNPGTNNLNSFGDAFRSAGRQWKKSLCDADSDGDGVSNGEELDDPDCTWTRGSTPKRTSDITHPGDANSKPSTTTTSITSTPTTLTTNNNTNNNTNVTIVSPTDCAGDSCSDSESEESEER